MAFSSIPAYHLDPSNGQQLPNHQLVANACLTNNSHSIPPSIPPQGLHAHHELGNSIRPGSMSDRALLANIPVPEQALKCPRCESTNTKFCYFNNYSLTQPRHFCKTCRRYWTRGGALRNVPVGGGCRRNNKKSSKSNNNKSKSPAASSDHQTGGAVSTNTATVPSSCGGGGGSRSADALLGISGLGSPPLRFMAPNIIHHFGDNFGYGGEFSGLANYGEIISPSGGVGDLNFHFTNLGGDSWMLGGSIDPHSTGFYPYGGGSMESSGFNGGASRVGEKMLNSGLLRLASVKLEDEREHNLSRRFRGVAGNEQHSFSGAVSTWTDRSIGLSSSNSMTTNNAA